VITQLVAELKKHPEHMTLTEEPQVLPRVLNPVSEDSNCSHHSPEPTEECFSESAQQAGNCHIKPATLNNFAGDCMKGRAFLNLCNLYIGLTPTQFADDHAKIM
jgi:hypothetical protein